MRVFIDTNLWAYRLDRREPAKRERMKQWLAEVTAEHEVVISTQVLIELRSVASRKLKPALSQEQLSAAAATFSSAKTSTTGAESASCS